MSNVIRPAPDPSLIERLRPMLEMLESDPASLSSVTKPERAVDVHLLDSLSATVAEEMEHPEAVVDIGSGAGFPGIPLAVARPGSQFDLIDSVGRKVDFMDRVISELGISNARTVKARSEEWAGGQGRERYAVATARAVAPLSVLAELASPLLDRGGSLIAWKGVREAGEEADLESAASRLSMELNRVIAVKPFPSSRVRHLYVIGKAGPTPEGLPRRPGMARKRPFGG